jgi:hypothetical protein
MKFSIIPAMELALFSTNYKDVVFHYASNGTCLVLQELEESAGIVLLVVSYEGGELALFSKNWKRPLESFSL